MKANIDLTVNRDFAKPRRIRGISALFHQPAYPWAYRSVPAETREVFFTGDKRERERKASWLQYKEGGSCERCGTDFSSKPWNGVWGMCLSCLQEMDQQESMSRNQFLTELTGKRKERLHG